MRIIITILARLLVLSGSLMAQNPVPQPVPEPQVELGKWWKNSEIVKKLQLSEAQVGQIEQSFLNHRRELADLSAELRNRETQLSILMQADTMDEDKIKAQTELVASARAALEKANASMMLSIRKALTGEQWKKLESIRVAQQEPSSGMPASQAAASSSSAAKAKKQSLSSGGKIYRMADGIKPPIVTDQSLPPYTPEAKEARIEGVMLLQGVIHKDGSVSDLKVLRGLGYGLDESAIDTITKRWRFEPGTMNGQPVDVQANIEVSFRLY